MAWPTGTPLREQIIADVATKLGAITAGGTYKTTMAKVEILGRNALAMKEYPAAYIVPPPQDYGNGPSELISGDLRLVVVLAVRTRDDSYGAIMDLIEDAKVALLTDHTRGGIATDTTLVSDLPYTPSVTDPVYAADLIVSVHYRHARLDATAAF